MNAHGDVVGASPTSKAADSTFHAFLSPHGLKMIDLGTLPGDKTSAAYGVNNLGQVVGLSFPAQNSTQFYRGFLYENGVMTDLNTLIAPNSGWTIRWGLSINDKGQILALAAAGGGEYTVLLTPGNLPPAPPPLYPAAPIPEPGTMATFGLLFAVSAWGLRLHSRRRQDLGCRFD